MQVTIPEFYIALVLSKCGEPSQGDYERLRKKTSEHLLQQLSKTHADISGLDLEFLATEFGAARPDPKFQVFIEAQVTVSFAGAHQPNAADVLETLLGTFGRDYLLKFVRTLDGSPLASAVEVQARRLKRPTAGGAVKAPAFYMAFVCSAPPTANPSTEEKERFLRLTQEEATRQLKKQYEEDFDDVDIAIVKTEINERAGKPEPQYNLYVEFEATATFSQNTPTPFELFQALGGLLNADYMRGVQQVGGSFMTLTFMVLRLCIFTEGPEQDEEEEEDGEGAGGGGDGEEEPAIVKVQLEFFVALGVRALSAMPDDADLALFDGCIEKFFSRVLKRVFRSRFISIEIADKNPEFEKGCPLPRFNMLHQYHATLQFYEPAPDEFKILSKITQGNVGPLFDAIKALDSKVWKNSGEVTMGRAVEKPPTDDEFGGKLEIEELEEIEEKKVEPKPEARAPAPPPPVKPVEKPKKKSPSPPKKKPSPPKKKPTPPKAVRQEGPQTVSVRAYEIFTALQVRNKEMEDLEVEPTAEDYGALVETTKRFYMDVLKAEYGMRTAPTKFHDVSVSIRGAPLWKADKPSPWYNIYIDWDIEADFVVAPGEEAPTSWELTKTLVSASYSQYMREYVRAMKGTPFAQTCAVFTKQVPKK